jgi:hypothetical protein
MSRESSCRCLLCALERSLTDQLAEPLCAEAYRHFADSRSLLSAFPSALELIGYLHTTRGASNGSLAADRILAELLEAAATGSDAVALRDLLLLAFIPMLHSTFRQVAARYPSLSTDDIAQHAVAALLQILGSAEFYGRSSHVAFAISRILKRNAFEWAERECRSPVYRATPETSSDVPSAYDTSEPMERAALLRHFLFRCLQRGLLTEEDLELLVQFKLDASRDRKAGGPAAVYSNASRQRMKRLLGKLRRIAATRKQDDAQLRLF